MQTNVTYSSQQIKTMMQYVGRPGLAETASSSLTSYSRVSQTGIHPVFRSCKTTLILSIKGSFQQLIFTINLALH